MINYFMLLNAFNIEYPPINPGTDKTEVIFFDSKSEVLKKIENTTNKDCNNIFVTDSNVVKIPEVACFYEKIKNQCCVFLEAGEENKTLDSALHIVKKAIDFGANRNSTFFGIGGGVVTDMTAFAASIFKRGAKLELIPTTLLGMVDASCGGKTGVDFDSYKNMIGTFFPAKRLLICSEFIETLSKVEYFSGLAEVLKTAMLYDKEVFELFKTERDKIIGREQEIVKKLIYSCIKAKSSIVEQDLTEKGIRMQLNFGHTFAHALESVLGLGKVPHGYAVAFGIEKATRVAEKLGLCDCFYRSEVLNVLQQYDWQVPKNFDSNSLLNAMKKDKKNSSKKIKLVLQKGLCNTVIQEVDDKMILEVLDK